MAECIAIGLAANQNMVVELPDYRLRQLQQADFTMYQQIFSSDRIQQFIEPVLPDSEIQQRFSASQRANLQRPFNKLFLAVEDKSSQQAIGMVAAFDFDWQSGTVELGIMLLPVAQRPGTARQVFIGLMRFMLVELQLQQVFCRIHPQNKAALRLARQCELQLLETQPHAMRFGCKQAPAAWPAA